MKLLVESVNFLATNPFSKANTFASSTFNSVLTLAITIFGFGVLVCGLMIWKGDEENVHKFKKGITWTVVGLIVSVLAKGIVMWVKSGVA